MEYAEENKFYNFTRTALAAGAALAPLRDEGVLILGSGNTFAMMAGMAGRARGVAGVDFDAWLSEATADPDPRGRERRLAGWSRAPGARYAHPREEHLLPLHVVAGAAGEDRGPKTLEDRVMGAVESAFRFG